MRCYTTPHSISTSFIENRGNSRNYLFHLLTFCFNSRMRTHLLSFVFLATATLASGSGEIAIVGSDTINFGAYPAREKRVATYTIRNAGDDTLRILRVRKTCGCASATASRTELEPGETAQIEVVILPNTIFGLFSKNTFVESSDVDNQFLKLNTAGHAIPLLEVLPAMALDAGRIKQDTAWGKEFSLTATETGVTLGEPVVTGSHPLTADLIKTGTNAISAYSLRISLPPADGSGDLRCGIAIPVLSPASHPPVNITISGRIGTELAVIPGIAYLSPSDKPQTRTFTLRILGQRSRVLKPEELVLPENKEITAAVTRNPRDNTLEATLTFSPEFVNTLHAEEKVDLTFAMPGTASANITCQIRKSP